MQSPLYLAACINCFSFLWSLVAKPWLGWMAWTNTPPHGGFARMDGWYVVVADILITTY